MDGGDGFQVVRTELGSGAMPDGWVHRKCIPFAILVQPTAGSYVVTGPDSLARVARGEFAFVAADTPVSFAHHADARGRMTARWLHVQVLWRDALDPCSLYLTPQRIGGAPARRLGRWLTALMAPPGTDMPDRLERLSLIHRMLAEAMRAATPHPRAGEQRAATTWLGPLSAWLRSHLHRPLTIDDIAVAARLSRSRLHALFAAQVGQPPMQYLKELRLSHAARLLLTTDDTVAAIAEAAGFANPFHLSREFARRYHVPPSRYRDQQRLWSGDSTATASRIVRRERRS